ncbi:MAG: protein BatD [Bdellovibrionales bacterium]|nr:protein BatD [Bdellovibrionales bacterium]
MKRIGKLILLYTLPLLCFSLTAPMARAAPDVDFQATVDKDQITEDDSITLRITVKVDGNAQIGNVQYQAPDFMLVNQFDNSFMESYYENGKFGVRNSREMTRVLRPNRTGKIFISGISLSVNGTSHSAPSIGIVVSQGGQGTPPPPSYGGAGVGLRGAGKRPPGSSKDVFVRAEVDKDHVYKGEQVIVSYYLYARVRVFNVQVDKYPTFTGFLREDLDIPVVTSNRFNWERVNLDGVPYQRGLLARYALYPLKEGNLDVDTMALRASHYSQRPGMPEVDEDDPFAPFMNFFQSMAPVSSTSTSDRVPVQVTPLPAEGRPADFGGAVGEFDIVSATDRYQIRAGEPLTLTVKIEGRGNPSIIEEPKVQWPSGFQVYETKGRTKSGKGGVGERIFEILLIPKNAGTLEIPGIPLSYFDPKKKQYVSKASKPISIQVLDAAPGSAAAQALQGAPPGTKVTGNEASQVAPQGSLAQKPIDVSGKGLEGDTFGQGLGYFLSVIGFRYLPWAILCIVLFMALAFYVQARRGRDPEPEGSGSKGWRKKRSSLWTNLQNQAKAARKSATQQDVLKSYDLLATAIFDLLDQRYGVSSRSLSRRDLKAVLVQEKGMDEKLFSRIAQVLEFAETVRFAAQAGVISEKEYREKLEFWVSETIQVENQFSFS